ncbi:MAG TPA: hypothetical protein VKU41_09145 [Polyangiaceae bacterium]|nr:hypothetical protein [Polyangiaceae bacterium]
MKLPHVLQLVFAFLAMVASHVTVAGETVTMQFSVPAAAASVLVAALTVIGMFSDSVQTTLRQKAAMALAKAGPPACFVLLCGALSVSQAGCTPQQLPAVVPAASCVTDVVADALKGMTIGEIIKAAGPGCVTDAEDVIAILLGSGDPRLPATKAYGQAKMARAGVQSIVDPVDRANALMALVSQ